MDRSPQSPSAADRVRAEARAQWTSDPAGAFAAGEAPLGTPESFRRIEAHRYAEQHWMHEMFEFDRFEGQRVLEVGVGLGTDHLTIARTGAELTGVDLTPRSVELTRARLAAEGLQSDVRLMDAQRLKFPDATFDVVYSFGVLHHVPDSEAAFREVRRVLRPGGLFIGALYARDSLFHARIRLQRAFFAEWRHESLEERLGRIEYSSGEAVPLVRLFGRRELTRTLEAVGFADVDIARRHLGLPRVARVIPGWLDRRLSAAAGWYLVHHAR